MSPKKSSKRMLASASVALLSLVFSLSAASSSSATLLPAEKVEAALRQQLQSGRATFWVLFRDRADLSAAHDISNWVARGQYVVDRLTATASSSQARVLALLEAGGVEYQSFHIVNTVRVVNGDASLADTLAARPEVSRLVASRTFHIPRPAPSANSSQPAAVEWNIQNINADDVWNTFSVLGRGIVVANIDTGVQFDHPALFNQYRGRRPGGAVKHNYSWWDPSNMCAGDVPCDNIDHGTHTMGTMVGDDGGANQIGVAPRAKWIAAKGCETNSCSDFALLSSAEWILAPTRLDGTNPRADLRPHVVNNSWAGGSGDPWYMDAVDAWVASGIFPAFAIGNQGFAGCGSAQSPGDYAQSYAAGAYDINNTIASFSSLGPSDFGGTKPNISAPGVNVRSSVPENSYDTFDGTSMASPHVAGTVALMWSAAPSLSRDIAATRDILDSTARNKLGGCGGDRSSNNTYGEGRLDAFAAVDAATP